MGQAGLADDSSYGTDHGTDTKVVKICYKASSMNKQDSGNPQVAIKY